MSDGMLHSFWNTLQRAEQSVEAEARDAERSLYRTLYGYESRVMRLRWALEASGPLARKEIEGKLKKVSLDAVWPILLSVVKDIALYYGGSVVLGTAVGAGVGALFFGAGAIPGAALGFEAGMVLGEWVMMYLGLKMLAEGLVDTIPPAMNCYAEGFRAAWGPTESDRPDARYTAGYAPSKETAAQRFAQGHVLMIMAILIAIVAYLMRGKSEEALFKAVGDSKRLGSKMADWLKENEKKLLDEDILKPKARTRAELQEEEQQPLNKKPRVANSQKEPEVPEKAPDKLESEAETTNEVKRPTYKIGQSDGGPGTWENSSKYPRDAADVAYQKSATGAPTGVEYKVDTPLMKSGVKYFDGYDPNTGNLIDAKNYVDWPNPDLPFSMKSVADDMIQNDAIAGDADAMVEYRVASQAKADLLKSIAQQNNLSNTVVTYWSP
jgi:hypothetical protein